MQRVSTTTRTADRCWNASEPFLMLWTACQTSIAAGKLRGGLLTLPMSTASDERRAF